MPRLSDRSLFPVTVLLSTEELGLIEDAADEMEPALYVREAAIDAAVRGRRMTDTRDA